MDPFVSVIIPTYNCSKYIAETIESVLAQTYRNYEIIVIDDGSIDDTRTVLKPYIDEHKIKYFFKENGGVSSARNLGIAKAGGDLIAVLDADDLWYPEKLEKQVLVMKENPDCGMVHTDSSVIDEHGKMITYSANKGRQSRNGYVFDEFFKSYYSLVVLSSALIRKRCFEEIGLFNLSLRIAADYEFFLRLFFKFPVFLIDKPLVKRRLVPGSLVKNTVASIQNCEASVNNFINKNSDYLKRNNIDLKKKWADFNYFSAMRLWHAREFPKSREYFKRVLGKKVLAWPYFLILSLPEKWIYYAIKIKRLIFKTN